MKRLLIVLMIVVVCLSLFNSVSVGSDSPLVTGDALSTVKLPIPQNPDARSYLGLSGHGVFRISQIKAEVVIIEIFSMYCPYCQREAPKVNELHRAIEKDPDLKEKIKMIGIGAGNSPFEVEVFRKTYQIPFPLFPDEDFSVHKACGEVRTPYFIGVKINADGSLAVFYDKLGGFKDASEFLQLMIKLSRPKEG